MKRMLHHAHTESNSPLKPASKPVKLKRHKPLTKREIKAGLELCRMMGIDPEAIPEERVREISKIWR